VRQAAQNAKSTRVDTVFVAGFVIFVIFVFGSRSGAQIRLSEGGASPATKVAMEAKS